MGQPKCRKGLATVRECARALEEEASCERKRAAGVPCVPQLRSARTRTNARAVCHEINWTPVKSEGVNFRVYVSLSPSFIRFNNASPDDISPLRPRNSSLLTFNI